MWSEPTEPRSSYLTTRCLFIAYSFSSPTQFSVAIVKLSKKTNFCSNSAKQGEQSTLHACLFPPRLLGYLQLFRFSCPYMPLSFDFLVWTSFTWRCVEIETCHRAPTDPALDWEQPLAHWDFVIVREWIEAESQGGGDIIKRGTSCCRCCRLGFTVGPSSDCSQWLWPQGVFRFLTHIYI